MNKTLILLVLVGSCLMATDIADMTLAEQQKRLDRLFKKDRVVVRQVRSSREERRVTREERESRVRETIHRQVRVARSERKTLHLARDSRKSRFAIFLASL